jgi:cathepsin L
MSRAFQYISHAGGLASEAAYNYTGAGGACKAAIKPVATVHGQVNLSMGDLAGLTAAVATKGPVSVAIDVNFCWQFYQVHRHIHIIHTGCSLQGYAVINRDTQ